MFVAIIILGFFLRFHNVADKELWYDEAFTAEIIDNSYQELLKQSALDVHPPLYYLTLKTFTGIFGNSELALRFPSIIFGVALIVLGFYLVQYMTSSTNRALFTALVIATNPFLVIYSREARSYSMLAFLTVLAFFLVLRALRQKKYLAISIVLPLLFLTHYISVFVILVYSLIMLWHSKKTFIYLLPVVFIMVLWIPTIIGSSNSTGLTWVPEFSMIRIPESIHAFLLGTDTNQPSVAPPLNPLPINSTAVSLGIFSIVGIFIAVSKPTKEARLLLICGIVPILLVALTSEFLGFNFYVEKFMTGYGALLLIYCVIITPRLIALLPYVFLCISLILTLKTTSIGYRELANHTFDKPIVMVDASDYITAKYYVKDIKLQNGDWRQWVIIQPDDIFDDSNASSEFYLVSREPIENWQPELTIGEFYFYNWNTTK